jgi:putative molybdopterin biosynthesis protein
VPLATEHYWLVCLASELDSPAVQQLRQLLTSPLWQSQLQGMVGYQSSAHVGQVQSLRSMLPWWQFKSERGASKG